jgi:protein-S-isoprenylcysteine O-methyltransferase Ste14
VSQQLFIQEHGGAFALVVGAIGANLALTNWSGLALAVGVPLLGHLPRIRVEERAMAGALGNEWVSYAAGTARIVPGVW